LEYFFLVVNGSHQVIRTPSHTVYEEGDDDLMDNQFVVDRSALLQVYSELGIPDKEDSAIIDEWVDVVPTPPGDQSFWFTCRYL